VPSSHSTAGDDSAWFVALRRAPTTLDQQFGGSVAPKISKPIADHELDVNAARVVVTGPEGAAALIPGDGHICFVSDTSLLGAVTSCIPSGFASTNGGFGIVGTIGNTTLVQGVVPDGVTGVQFGFASGSTAAMVLHADNGYSQVLDSEPVSMTYFAGARIVAQRDFRPGTPRGYHE